MVKNHQAEGTTKWMVWRFWWRRGWGFNALGNHIFGNKACNVANLIATW